MPRLRDIEETDLSPAQAQIYKAIKSGPRGVVEGPLRVWLNSPDLADAAQRLGAFCRYGTVLGPRLSELAILVTGAFWKSGFEWAVHAPIARQAGLSLEVVEAIRQGLPPVFEHEDEAIIYAFSSEMHRDHLISPATYDRAVTAFGERALVELVGILGYYTLISMTINAFEVPLPKDAPDPFAE
jgi:4-carboxymuconolactone decarboxylase